MRFQFTNQANEFRKVKIIGVGGAGCNIVNTMVEARIDGVNFIATNTDLQSLSMICVPKKVQIGVELTGGLGSGGDPKIGRKAIEENKEEVREVLKGADIVFITCGMGGGTGTGASPIIAQLVKEFGAFVISMVTTPFEFEGERRANQSIEGICELKKYADAVIVIPNQMLLSTVSRETSFLDAFRIIDRVIFRATRGIAEIILHPSFVNVDFADIRSVMSEPGDIVIGTGEAKGTDRAIRAVNQAVNSSLLNETIINGARGILVNITGGKDLALQEINDVLSAIHEKAGNNANIIFGACPDKDTHEEIGVTLIVTGIKTDTGELYKDFSAENLKIPAFKRRNNSLFS